jgi:hypothetical protein
MEQHHILPRRFGGGDEDENIVTLCASCHNAVESIYAQSFWASIGLRPSGGCGSVEEYIEERLDIDRSHPPTPKNQLYKRYEEWCKNGNVEPESQHMFTKRLTRLRDVTDERAYIDGERYRCYNGVKLSTLSD